MWDKSQNQWSNCSCWDERIVHPPQERSSTSTHPSPQAPKNREPLNRPSNWAATYYDAKWECPFPTHVCVAVYAFLLCHQIKLQIKSKYVYIHVPLEEANLIMVSGAPMSKTK